MYVTIQRAHQARPFLLATAAAAAAARSSSLARRATMKSIQFSQVGGPEVLEWKDVDKPVAGPGQVVVKNEYIGVNFIDTYFRTGLYKRELPTGLGEEGAGTVEAVGQGVSGLQAGDAVVYMTRSALGGSYADFTAVKADTVTKLPEGVSGQAAAAVLLQGLTALSMLKTTCEVKPGDWVLVHAAAGGTGQLLVQIASHIGAKVIGTTSTQEKADIAKRCGCVEVILYSHEDVVERVMQITGGRGVMFVYDGVGKSTFDASLKVLDYLGWLICFGNASGKPEPLDILRLGEKSARLMRPSLFSTLQAAPGLYKELTAELLELVKGGVVVPQVHRVYPLSAAAEAQTNLTSRRTTGKVLLRPDALIS